MSFVQPTAPDNPSKPDSKDYQDNNAVSQAVLAPLTSSGIMGWTFDIPKREAIRLQAEITDHYTESNLFINDNIVRKPIRITLTGQVGELVSKETQGFITDFNDIEDKLTSINAYEGDYSDGLKQEIRKKENITEQKENEINEVINKTKDMFNPFNGVQLGIMQKAAYAALFSFYKSNFVLSVMTPWSFFPFMKIEEILFEQGEESASYSDISVELKEIRFATTKTTEFDENSTANREQLQNQDVQDSGIVKGADSSILFETVIGGG